MLDDATRIARICRFSNFANAAAFVRQAVDLAEAETHHPGVSLSCRVNYGFVTNEKDQGLHETTLSPRRSSTDSSAPRRFDLGEHGMAITIVAEQGTHLLIADGDRYAVIERRKDQLYNCHDEKRVGVPADDLSGVARILDDGDWTDAETARATFTAIAERGTQLAQRML